MTNTNPAASQPGWQPIATAPTNGMRIILGIAGTTVYPHDELCHLATWDGVNCHPYVPNAWTHWHALPAAPAASQPSDLQRQRVLANALAAVQGKK